MKEMTRVTRKPRYVEYDNMLFPAECSFEILQDAMSYKPETGDIFVVTYPKCGTTWTTQIISLILRNGEPLKTAKEYFQSIPFLEMTPMEEFSKIPKPRCIKTHLPFDCMNFSTEAKYVYVARHPADCVVSYYHHLQFFPTFFFSDGVFDDLFELFIKGEVENGDYFDHLLDGYSRRNEPNVLFLTYESMMADPREACLKIARFLGEEYYRNLIDNDEAVLQKILKYSSLDFMKSTVNEFWKEQFINIAPEEDQKSNPILRNLSNLMKEAMEKGEISEGKFIRKGTVGEGKVILSDEQRQRLQHRILEKTAHSDVMSLWKE
ncbi:sulfotransferase 1B1-like isoform X2 [Argiope bruennichi]|uniref:sulfotransferase 1B1-like isoform X2 n=1 Tax=Argiope bruennichi TaxID=94029 RepID=UPI00249588C1|nr:sulfotransferase 1B1-like isoform X2 [Argiope bruennichi]